MGKIDHWLYFKSGVFSYLNKIGLLITGFLYTYILANFFGPKDYGLAMYLMAFTGNLVFLVGAEAFGNALIVFTPKYHSKKLFCKFLKILLVTCGSLFLLFYFLPWQISAILTKGSPELIKAVAFLLLVFPFFLLSEAFFRGQKSFGKVLKVSMIESISNLVLAFAFVVVLGYWVFGIIYAKLSSLTISSFVYIFLARKPLDEKEINGKKIKGYVKKVFVVNILKKVNMQLMLLYMGLFISKATLGLYYLVEKIVGYIIQAPVNALSEAMLPFASEVARNKKKLAKLASLNIKFSILLGLVFGIIAMTLATPLLVFFFPSYIKANWIFPFFVVIFITSTNQFISNIFRSINRPEYLVRQWVMVIAGTAIIGYFFISEYALFGLLSLRILTEFFIFFYLYHSQRKLGINIEIIPRIKDFVYFFSLFKKIVVKRTKK